MSEETATEAKGEEKQESKIELDVETYSALLDRIAELETATAVPKQSRNEPLSIEELVAEAKPQKQPDSAAKPPPDLDELSNSQLAAYMVDMINRQAAERLNKVEVAVETMRVLREIDKAEAKYDDFWQYEDKIKEISIANPSLGIEDAYQLAKTKSPAKKKEGDETTERKVTKTERLLNLPARTFGEKPTVAAGSTRNIERGETLKSAAVRAWEDVVGKGKATI